METKPTTTQPSSNRTKVLILILAIITGLLVIFSLPKKDSTPIVSNVTQQNQIPTPTASVAQTTLALAPNPVVTSSSSAIVDVVIDAPQVSKNNITAIQLEISFDPKRISGISVLPGTFFKNPITMLNQVNTKTGKATFAMGIAPTGNPPSGTGVVAKLNLRLNPASKEPTELMLLPSSIVTAEGISQSVLKSAAGTTIQFSP